MDTAPDAIEREVAHDRFVFSLAQLWASTDLRLTDRRLLTRRPNLALGVIPTGSDQSSFPLRNVAGVGTAFRFGILKVPLAVILFLMGLSLLGQKGGLVGFLVFAVFGLLFLSAGLRTWIWVENTAGQRVELPIIFWQRGRAQALAERINLAIGRLG